MKRRSDNQHLCNRQLSQLRNRVSKLEKAPLLVVVITVVQQLLQQLWTARQHSPRQIDWAFIDLAMGTLYIVVVVLVARAFRALAPTKSRRRKAK